MSSSEVPGCKECGQTFDTIDDLKEHVELEKQDKVMRNKGYDDG